MDLKYKCSINRKRIRFCFSVNLVFFIFLTACTDSNNEKKNLKIQWEDEKAQAVIIPLSFLTDAGTDSVANHLQVRLINNTVPVIHEEITVINEAVKFKPLVAFTHGLQYEVLYSGKIIGRFEIPPLSTENLTKVLSVYPTADTLPENTLKIYIVFSNPMQEGQAMQNIHFIKNEKDTLYDVFLDLSPELWNKERTILTLWFDPGRIKRDLQPNQNLGLPLQQSNRYNLIIDKNWRDERGLALWSGFEKYFFVGKRDGISPNPTSWNVSHPRASTKETLRIELQESLDYMLLKNTVSISANDGTPINGSFETAEKEKILTFIPSETWKPGEYSINIEARLEDLAGNNLNRLFDRDLTQPGSNDQQKVFTKKFRVI